MRPRAIGLPVILALFAVHLDLHPTANAAPPPSAAGATAIPGGPKFFPLPHGTRLKEFTTRAGADGGPAAAPGKGGPEGGLAQVADPAQERLIYSNTLGKFAVPLLANSLMADDITTTAPDGCELRRYSFQVIGKADPEGTGGPFTIHYALYRDCPRAYPEAMHDELIIPGTSASVSLADDSTANIITVSPSGVPIPTNLYFGIMADRENVGLIMGAPPLSGLSCDTWDTPSEACGSNVGGLPNQPHASANLQLFADTACPPAFVGYRNDNPRQSAFNPGPFKLVADDIHLNTSNCRMVAYEVVVKGQGSYTFDLRGNCEGGTIPGTLRVAQVNDNNSNPQKLHFDFDPPISLPGDFVWFSAVTHSSTAGVVMTGSGACTGFTDDLFGILDIGIGACTIFSPDDPIQKALDVTITCQGSPPVGACCDMFVLDDQGEAVCRQLPEMNCPYPPRGSIQLPHWMPGAACNPNPFPLVCGLSACCAMYEHEDPNGGASTFAEDCKHLTQNQCNAQHLHSSPYTGHCSVTTSQSCVDRDVTGACPSGRQCCPSGQQCVGEGSPSLWQRGWFCGQQGQSCPRIACLQRGEDCTTPHNTFGCNDAFCCDAVCRSGEDGDYCCTVEWDSLCVQLAGTLCYGLAPSYDHCSSSRPGLGAKLLQVPGTISTNLTNATEDPCDPDFCCHTGLRPVCIGGPSNDIPCTTSDDCCGLACGRCGKLCDGGPHNGATCDPNHGNGDCCSGQPPQCGVCLPPVACTGGPLNGAACTSDGECCGQVCGSCPGRQPGPAPGVGTMWFKFVMPQGQTSVQLSTCGSSNPANDSLIQIFRPEDPTSDETACTSLIPIGCNDDSAGCSDGGTNSKLCARNLTPDTLYYAMLAAKTEQDQTNATYKLDIVPSCSGQGQVGNDFCNGATNVGEGVTPFDLANATPDCPLETCLPSMVNDIWYDYTATCNGRVVIQTCGADVNSSPNTGLAVYAGCDACSPDLPDPIACNDFAGGLCGFGSRVVLDKVRPGQCFKVRLTDDSGEPASGNLAISCLTNCPAGSISANTPPNNVVDARRPFDPGAPEFLQGIRQVKLAGPSNAASTCFSVCETTSGVIHNAITSIQSGPGSYTVILGRPLWPGALAKIKYSGGVPPGATTYISHPGNVNGDGFANAADVSALIARLRGGEPLPWGAFSEDIDRSGVLTPLDVLDEIDLLNGASGYDVWNGTARATPNANCP